MPAPFKKITREQFAELLAKFPFKRKINAVHMHHTWRPNHAQYRGHDSIVAMWRFHTRDNGWSDIAQHITIAPDGAIWLGRDWNRPPASAAGHNGNAQAGPFMFEMIGDFDDGKDPFNGEQRTTALEVIARVQQRFGLPPGTLQLHNMMSTKSCPGTSIDYQIVLRDIAALHPQLMGSTRAVPPDGPFDAEQTVMRQVVTESIDSLQRATSAAPDPYDAEPCFHREGHDDVVDADARDLDRAASLGIEARQALRPHVVNLRMGMFSNSGEWTTSAQDVDAIFDDHLPAALKAAQADGRKLKLMVYAHGGLNDERGALVKTEALVKWWKANGIYPIHFVWETGLTETLGQMLQRSQQGRDLATRNFFSDTISDPLVEAFAHRAGGVQIWNAMKWSAQQASAANGLGGAGDASGATPGGARYLATKLAAFCKAHRDEVEVHACGHSAGSIFHAHFIPCALEAGVPQIHSLHLMAPAVRVDLFRQQLQARVGKDKGIGKLTMYTMEDGLEKDDDCGVVYRKSLLYLVHRGLEPEVNEPILGLERCIRGDAGLKQLFSIGGGQGDADIVWSDNGMRQGRSASQSRTHGGFDDDPATMGSIVRRVLGKADADIIAELPASRQAANPWHAPADIWTEILAEYGVDLPAAAPPQPAFTTAQASAAPPRPAPSFAGGRRTALCVGIDKYPTAPLYGCVNDTRAWSEAFMRLGFDTPRMLLDAQATRAAIVQHLQALVNESRAGDVIVFQYAGHGTQVPDLDGDERAGDTPGEDEALCPYDFATGELLIDDDMGAIFRLLPAGVNLTCFFDCCHSGTINRFAVGGPGGAAAGKRARFVPADRALIENYARRRAAGGGRSAPGGGTESLRDVVFSACLSSEVAWESNGNGDFTRYAMQVLASGIDGMNNGEFAERIVQAFGASTRQHVKLYSSDADRALGLLQPLAPPTRGVPAAGRWLTTAERAAFANRAASRRGATAPLTT